MKITQLIFNMMMRRIAAVRAPDLVIGGHDSVYLNRWYVTPWRGWFRDVDEANRRWWQKLIVAVSRLLPNVYLHEFKRSDDDRALHDHPWLFNASLVLHAEYIEHTIAAGGIHVEHVRRAGDIKVRLGGAPHRIELRHQLTPTWTLFITGPVVREWGFHCPHGWVHWKKFTANNGTTVGRGCGP